MSSMCIICLECLGTEEVSAVQCGHLYHNRCLQAWFVKSKTCPQCRKAIDQSNTVFPLFFTEVADSPSKTLVESSAASMSNSQALDIMDEDLDKINSSLDNMLEELRQLHVTLTPPQIANNSSGVKSHLNQPQSPLLNTPSNLPSRPGASSKQPMSKCTPLNSVGRPAGKSSVRGAHTLNSSVNVRESSAYNISLNPTIIASVSSQNCTPSSVPQSVITSFESDTSHLITTINNIASTKENVCSSEGRRSSKSNSSLVLNSLVAQSSYPPSRPFVDCEQACQRATKINSFINSQSSSSSETSVDSSDSSDHSWFCEFKDISPRRFTHKSSSQVLIRQSSRGEFNPTLKRQMLSARNPANKSQTQIKKSQNKGEEYDSSCHRSVRGISFWQTSTCNSQRDSHMGRRFQNKAKSEANNYNHFLNECYPTQDRQFNFINKEPTPLIRSSAIEPRQNKKPGVNALPLCRLQQNVDALSAMRSLRSRSGADSSSLAPGLSILHRSPSQLSLSTLNSINHFNLTYANNGKVVTWDNCSIVCFFKWVVGILVLFGVAWMFFRVLVECILQHFSVFSISVRL